MSRTVPFPIPGPDAPQEPRIISPAPRYVWRHLLAADGCALPTQTPEWTDRVCRTLGAVDANLLYEFPDGRRLVLPLVARTTAGVRSTEETMPYGFGNGGVVVAGARPSDVEMRVVLADLVRQSVVRTSLMPSPLEASAWAAVGLPGTARVPPLGHVLDLEGGFDAVWSIRYRQDARRSMRRALKQDIDVRVEDPAVVEAFAELNARSVVRWAAQRGQPLWLARQVERRRDRAGQLAAAVATLGPACTTWTAYVGGEAAAVYVALVSGPSAWFWMSAMDKDLADRTRAGALLQSLAVEHACTRGVRWFYLGESDPGSGVARFKEGFGAVPHRFHALRVERLPLTAADRRLRRLAGRVRVARPARFQEGTS